MNECNFMCCIHCQGLKIIHWTKINPGLGRNLGPMTTRPRQQTEVRTAAPSSRTQAADRGPYCRPLVTHTGSRQRSVLPPPHHAHRQQTEVRTAAPSSRTQAADRGPDCRPFITHTGSRQRSGLPSPRHSRFKRLGHGGASFNFMKHRSRLRKCHCRSKYH